MNKPIKKDQWNQNREVSKYEIQVDNKPFKMWSAYVSKKIPSVSMYHKESKGQQMPGRSGGWKVLIQS